MKRLVSIVSVAALACLLAAGVLVLTRDDEGSATGIVYDVPTPGSGNALSEEEPRRLSPASEDARQGSADRSVNRAVVADRVPARTKAGEAAAWPPDIENRIWEYFAHRGKSNITSIISIECNPTDCEIVFTGNELNPRFVDTFSNLYSDMYAQPWKIRQGGIGTREIAPGVRAYVIGISNVPYDDAQGGAAEPEETSNPPDE